MLAWKLNYIIDQVGCLLFLQCVYIPRKIRDNPWKYLVKITLSRVRAFFSPKTEHNVPLLRVALVDRRVICLHTRVPSFDLWDKVQKQQGVGRDKSCIGDSPGTRALTVGMRQATLRLFLYCSYCCIDWPVPLQRAKRTVVGWKVDTTISRNLSQTYPSAGTKLSEHWVEP